MNAAPQRKPTRNAPSLLRHRLRQFAAVALVAASAIVLSATAASADIVVDNDPVLIAAGGGPVDFGSSSSSATPTATGSPVGAGNVAWAIGLTANTARVKGTVWYDNPTKLGCASLRVTLYDINGDRVANHYTSKVCRTQIGAAVPKAPIDVTLSDALSSPENNPKTNAYRLRVVARVSYNNGLTWAENLNVADAYLGGG